MGISKGKGYTAPSQGDIELMLAASKRCSPILICIHWREALVISGAWGLVGGLRMQMCDQVLLDSFNSLYGLIPGLCSVAGNL